MATKFPVKLTSNIKKDINYQIKISPAVIKVPITDSLETKIIPDVMDNQIQYVKQNDKWYEIVAEVHKEYKGEKQDHYLIRVDKKEHARAYPFNSFGYFVLPPELEAVYGKRCSVLTDIIFMSNDISYIFVKDNHVKFEFGGISCIGDGEKANRFNPVTEVWDKGIPCVCGYSRYYKDYTGEELATEVDIVNAGMTEKDNRIIKRGNESVQQVLVQGAWRDVLSRSGAVIKLKPFVDNKAPCDFNFEIVFIVPKVPGIHRNKIHSTGIENYLRLKETLVEYQTILRSFGINIATQPMNLVLRVVEKNTKVAGKRKFPQISIEFSRSIMELVNRNSRDTYLEQGHHPLEITSGNIRVDEETGEFADYEETEEQIEELTELQEIQAEYLQLVAQINRQSEDPNTVENLFKEKQITESDTQEFYTQAMEILNEYKLKIF